MKIGILQTGLAPDELKGSFGEYPGFFERLLAGKGFTIGFTTARMYRGPAPVTAPTLQAIATMELG